MTIPVGPILCLAILLADPIAGRRPAPPELPPAARSWPVAVGCPRDDLEFMRSVEDFAADHAATLPASRRPSGPILLAIGGLGCSHWATREAAARSLESRLRAEPSGARWLFWGRRHPDPEVRLRCNGILRRLNPCDYCHGLGWFGEDPDYAIPCKDCGGARSSWPWSMWD